MFDSSFAFFAMFERFRSARKFLASFDERLTNHEDHEGHEVGRV
jgi:hypothetical protein